MLKCFLIGADSLLMECGQTLLREGHEIRGIITATPRIADWAREQRLPVIDLHGDYIAALRQDSFDYLFSITHLSLLPAEVLSLPRGGAINFHDGPLPRYAGLNDPAWAIIHGETNYGITWHFITPRADEGDILRQSFFEVAPDDTSLTLNTKCFQAAMDSFQELIRDLDAGTISRQKQDLSQRTYFSKFQRPPAACFVDWNQSAQQLEALVRALDFGRYWNPLGMAKVQLNRQVVAIRKAKALAPPVDEHPGTILSLEESGIQIATANGSLLVSEFSALSGKVLSPAELIEHWDLRVGSRFDELTEEERQRRTQLAAACCKSESFWLKRLQQLRPLDVADSPEADRSVRSSFRTETLTVPTAFLDLYRDVPLTDLLATVWTAYLARITDQEEFDVSYRDPNLRQQVGDTASWIANHLPWHLHWDKNVSFREGLSRTLASLEKLRERGTWPWDLVGRAPELRDQPLLASGRLLPTAIELVETGAPATRPVGSTVSLVLDPTGQASLVIDNERWNDGAMRSFIDRFTRFLEDLASAPDRPLYQTTLLSEKERHQLLYDWNHTDVSLTTGLRVHDVIQQQVAATPDAEAMIFEGQTLTYRQLDERANQLAHHLQQLGVGPDRLVGICVERSLDLVVAALATFKAGGAYVPLDPEYPRDRLEYMLNDSKVVALIVQDHLANEIPSQQTNVVRIDTDWPTIGLNPSTPPHCDATSDHLAYVIYTSGSTGKPKGVMVEHGNVLNFFAGMDERIVHDPPGTWLAVTSLSFDISVLELFWTLARGFRVVLYRDRQRQASNEKSSPQRTSTAPSSKLDQMLPSLPAVRDSQRPIDFSLFYFSSSERTDEVKYRLLTEGARFGDEHGFAAVWTPERHFNAFGGLYPNPSVTGAALAVLTRRMQIRAGSVVLPLHHPIRVAEEWSVIDNLSGGRAAISVAAGWQPNDFLLRPESFGQAKQIMFRDLEIVKRLWRGEVVEFANPVGQMVPVTTQPRPLQKELPVWVTTAGNIETYKMAGAVGAHVLTHLLGQSIAELAPKIAAYRQARAENGFDPDAGIVSLMLHTFVHEDASIVRSVVREPLRQYLGTALNLLKQYAWSFPAFRRPANLDMRQDDDLFAHLTEEERDALLEHAFERYYETSGLFGRPADCVAMVNALKTIGVDDIACLIDFGVPTDDVLSSLPYLNELRELSQPAASLSSDGPSVTAVASACSCQLQADTTEQAQTVPHGSEDYSITALLDRYQVTHLQCTPSMARMLLQNEATRTALQRVKQWMIGGEAFPVALAQEINSFFTGRVTNMYGPTETTVWSTTHDVTGSPDLIPLGRPIANTQIYVLDAHQQPVPCGRAGELCIGGLSVTRGYLHQPELTASRFLPNPFRTQPGARIYRTGDLVRYREDGTLEFLGRIDHQVKIRGYRIELGEIESLLGQHPSVQQAVVIVREDQPGDQRLTAYLVGTTSQPMNTNELREFLRDKLPTFMVPAQWVTLQSLPLTPNGKIDRKALPKPAAETAPTATAFVAPQDELQSQIAELWKKVLGRDQLGIDDNFFDLGGHSLLVVVLHRQLKEQLNQPLSLTDLYRFPTIRALCDHVSKSDSSVPMQQSADRAQRRLEALQRRRGRSS